MGKRVYTVAGNLKFFAHNGQVFATLAQLARGIQKMDSQTFSYHSNSQKSDFAHWIKDAMHRVSLGKEVEEARDNKEKVLAALRHYLRTAY